MTRQEKIIEKIRIERRRQDLKWGEDRDLSDDKWMVILIEEVGEVAKGILECVHPCSMDSEIIQVAAVAIAWLESRAQR